MNLAEKMIQPKKWWNVNQDKKKTKWEDKTDENEPSRKNDTAEKNDETWTKIKKTKWEDKTDENEPENEWRTMNHEMKKTKPKRR